MGKKIIIVDNRQERARGLLSEEWDHLHQLSTYVDKVEDVDLPSYDVIAIHGSYIIEKNLESIIRDLLKDKFIVEFSGGITQVNLIEDGHLLKMPAIKFYSTNLIPFCSYLTDEATESIDLSMLVYGVDHWRFPQLLSLRYLLWQYPVKDHRPRRVENRIDQLLSSLSITNLEKSNLDSEINKELMAL